MTDSTGLNIYQRINEVRNKVHYIRKDKKIDKKNYKVVTHDQVTAEVRPYLIEFGIVIVPTLIASQMHDGVIKFSNSVSSRYDATYKFTFVNVDDPKDFFECVIEAHGVDNGDKAPGKVLSYATKYAILKVFCIETGDNEESVIGERISNEQARDHIESLRAMLRGIAKDGGSAALEKAWLEDLSKIDRIGVGTTAIDEFKVIAKAKDANDNA